MSRCRLRLGFFVAVVGIVSGCSTGGMPGGENMLMAMPIPEDGWAVTSSRIVNLDTFHWARPATDDTFVVTILKYGELTPARFRSISEEKDRKNCLTFESRTMSETPRNGFPSLLLYTSCQRPDLAVSRLSLFIDGDDADYTFTRSWRKHPDAAEIDAWSKYLADATVCDTRPDRKAPCPIGDKGGNIQVTGDNKIVAK